MPGVYPHSCRREQKNIRGWLWSTRLFAGNNHGKIFRNSKELERFMRPDAPRRSRKRTQDSVRTQLRKDSRNSRFCTQLVSSDRIQIILASAQSFHFRRLNRTKVVPQNLSPRMPRIQKIQIETR